LLDRVAAPRPLSKPARERANALEDGERMEGPRPAVGEPGRAEDAERGVGDERSVIARRLAESREVLGPAAAHHHRLAAARVDLGQGLLEASHLLTAE